MISELERLDWKQFKGEAQWIRCFAHILARPEFDDSDKEEEKHEHIVRFNQEQQNCHLDNDEDNHKEPDGKEDPELAFNDDLTLDNLEDLEREDLKDNYTSDLFPSNCHETRKSPNSKAKFIEICEEAQCKKPHTIECDVPTWWNSTYKQLSSIVQCEEAIVLWQRNKQFGMARNYHVQQEDFDLAADLVRLLQPFYKITLQFSTKASAWIAEVVLMIDQITSNLAAVIAKQDSEQDHPPALQNVCCAGLCITNKYYSLTDCSPLYRIAMVLHPSFKDKYFKLAKWPKEWVDEAVKLTREMYNKWYKPRNVESAPSAAELEDESGWPQTGVLAGLGDAAAARIAAPQVTPLPDGSQVPCIWINGDRFMPSSGGRSKKGVEIHIKALNRWPLMSCVFQQQWLT
ncbi:hypothetical protein PGT21_019293 [Puccinia graminis f. sp. tritici]|uniref:HAT C-terminal dimerisation domain-containing protein n=1 Tax=Puccinia graminis f. sp. tritici TaxID=56615 RepID=A0A5B0MU48_PUCGR|nr:hypothetical protein PGT21_019293 [Puccinia graminis f. sp. tritici]